MSDIDLGFPEERASAWLTNRYFPSKVGGRPAWLELSTLPNKEKLLCGGCQQPKAFLCQIYAPYEDEHNFHRSIFVFVCRAQGCQVANSANNLTVLRSQLPMQNDYYATQPPAETGEPLPAVPTKQRLCLVCGCAGPMACARCHKANYCSAQHQRAHWKQHKVSCGAEVTVAPATIQEIVFPECEIVMETSDDIDVEIEKNTAKNNADSEDDEDDDDDEAEKTRLAAFEKLAAAGKTGALQDVPDAELDKYAQTSEQMDDKHFRQFKQTVAQEPDQILRYKRKGSPLWIADVAQTLTQSQLAVPACELCGGARQFEFQIMPQLLLLLKDEHLDWGVIAVYTCANSCRLPEGIGYAPEYVVKQDILQDNKQ